MTISPADAKARVLTFLKGRMRLFAALEDDDGRGAQLFEPGSGKSLAVRWDDLDEVAEKASPLRPHPYLVLVFKDGRQVALADVGFAFAPSTASTGPLPDLPPTFCFRDYRHLAQGVDGLLAEDGREKEALAGVMLAIALLDGARIAGFEISREERNLEQLLQKLEQRGVRM
jgi:hypothetical protein